MPIIAAPAYKDSVSPPNKWLPQPGSHTSRFFMFPHCDQHLTLPSQLATMAVFNFRNFLTWFRVPGPPRPGTFVVPGYTLVLLFHHRTGTMTALLNKHGRCKSSQVILTHNFIGT